MAQLLVRNLGPETIDCLKNRAKLHHRSLQGEIKTILEEAANASNSNISSWPPGFLEGIVGGWKGDPLTRSTQGEYEQRDDL